MKLLMIGTFVSILTFGLLEEPIARACGKIVARYHLAHGRHRLYIGAAPKLFPIYSRMFRERYGVDEVYFVGCTVDGWDGAYLDGYSSVMQPEIDRIYGKDFWIPVLQAAQAEHDANPPTPPR